MHTANNRLSRYVYFFCVIVMCYTSFVFYPRWKQGASEAAISWDVSGYYWYLPSVFIYKDLKHQSFKDSVLNKYRPTNLEFQQGMQLPNGNWVMKYSSGMAVMYLPFFTAAHLLAGALGYPADGFSTPYQLGIQLGGFLIAMLGLWYLRKLLLIFYKDKVVAVVLALLVIGTNYLTYAAIDCGMSHSWLFTVYVFLLLNTHYFYQTFKLKYAVRIGLLVGLATLTRPTDVISCVIPLLWGLESITPTAIRNHIRLILSKFRLLLVAAVCAVVVISIQLIYWKYVSGHWIVYSYGDQGFSWKHPHAFLYALNYRTGWLTYAPTLFLAFAGIIPFIKNGRNKVAILAFFLLNYYIVSSWNVWWYGGRAMVQSYPVLLFPIASLVDYVLDRKILTWIFAPVALLLIYFNIWVTRQSHGGGLYDGESMTQAYFWRVAGRWSAPPETIMLRDVTEVYEPQPTDAKVIYQNDFSHENDSMVVRDSIRGIQSLQLSKAHQLSPVYTFAFNGRGAKWLRLQATYQSGHKEWDTWKMAQADVKLMHNGQVVKENMMRIYRLLGDNETRTINMDVLLPQEAYDTVSILFWNADSDKPLLIRDMKAFSFTH